MTNADQIFDALGDPTRRAVFARVRRGPLSVSDIASGMEVTRAAVSQHLKVLKDAGLVVDRPEGTRRIYSVDSRGVRRLREWLDEVWDVALAAFKEAAEREATRQRENP
jgi:DNA-binding transcriptional ArsR family regulator